MALPQPLRVSVTPPELELIASEHLIEIIPLIAMEKTAFISVERMLVSYELVLTYYPGCIRATAPPKQVSHTALDGYEPKAEEEVPHCPP